METTKGEKRVEGVSKIFSIGRMNNDITRYDKEHKRKDWLEAKEYEGLSFGYINLEVLQDMQVELPSEVWESDWSSREFQSWI